MLWATYREDVARIAEHLPARAREYALAPWHCNPNDHRCIHDAWIEEIRIADDASGSRRERRRVAISIRLFGAYHDRYLTLQFSAVRRYSIARPVKSSISSSSALSEKRQAIVGHGDALEDAIRLGEIGHFVYSLRLEFGQMEIEAQEMEFSEELLQAISGGTRHFSSPPETA